MFDRSVYDWGFENLEYAKKRWIWMMAGFARVSSQRQIFDNSYGLNR